MFDSVIAGTLTPLWIQKAFCFSRSMVLWLKDLKFVMVAQVFLQSFQGPRIILYPRAQLKEIPEIRRWWTYHLFLAPAYRPFKRIAMVGLPFFGACFLSFWGLANAGSIIVQEGSSSADYGSGVVLASGLPIVSGTTSGNFPGMTSSGYDDAIVVKYNIDGTQAAIKTFGTSSDERIYARTIDDSNNVYVTGYTDGDLAGSTGSRDTFVAKLDSSLAQVWLIQPGSTASDSGYAVAVDSASRVIVGGYTGGAFTGQTTSLGSDDAFIMQYSSGGSREWVIQFGSSVSDQLYGLAVDTVGSVDDIYGTGTSGGTFEGQSNSGDFDIFLIKV